MIDVRAVPNSRRPGFSKTPLRNALAEAGIDYVHLRALGRRQMGEPLPGRDGKRISSVSTRASSSYPRRSPQGAQMVDLATEKPSALLCFERDPAALPPDASAGGGDARRGGRAPLRLTLSADDVSRRLFDIEGDDPLPTDPSTRPNGLTVM